MNTLTADPRKKEFPTSTTPISKPKVWGSMEEDSELDRRTDLKTEFPPQGTLSGFGLPRFREAVVQDTLDWSGKVGKRGFNVGKDFFNLGIAGTVKEIFKRSEKPKTQDEQNEEKKAAAYKASYQQQQKTVAEIFQIGEQQEQSHLMQTAGGGVTEEEKVRAAGSNRSQRVEKLTHKKAIDIRNNRQEQIKEAIRRKTAQLPRTRGKGKNEVGRIIPLGASVRLKTNYENHRLSGAG